MNKATEEFYESNVFINNCLNILQENFKKSGTDHYLPISAKAEFVFMIKNSGDDSKFSEKLWFISDELSRTGLVDGQLFNKLIYNHKDAIISNERYIALASLWEDALGRQEKINGKKICTKEDKIKMVREFVGIQPKNKMRDNVFIEAKEAFDSFGLEGQRFYGLMKNWVNKPELNKTGNDLDVKFIKTENISANIISEKKIINYLKTNHPNVLRSFVVEQLSKSVDEIADNFIKTI